jgi:hypothetical protein
VNDLHPLIADLVRHIDALPFNQKVEAINGVREAIHKASPFASEPVDFVRWVASDDVFANDYNPNSVAPPEMELLRRSIMSDGYTQPIVTHFEPAQDGVLGYCVVDGFHRNRVGKECEDVQKRVKGYLPVVKIRESQEDKSDRMASTIRHNRARGKHKVEAMSDIVIELKRRNWSDEKISRELGMDQDEILRLCQITGLAELFSDQDFSKAWDVEGDVTESDFEELTDDITTYDEDEASKFRTVNTNDPQRVFHTYDKWECHKAGFYASTKDGMTKTDCEAAYREFLADIQRFETALTSVTSEWKHSCEHYLTNAAMNRIAWLGQAAMCYATGIPSAFRGGYNLLTQDEKYAADMAALKWLNRWLKANNRHQVMLPEACGRNEADIY